MTANQQIWATMVLALATAGAGALFGLSLGYRMAPVVFRAVRAPYVAGDTAEDGMTGEDLKDIIRPKHGRVSA